MVAKSLGGRLHTQWYTEVIDDTGLRYVVPVDMKDVWYAWVKECEDGKNTCEPPDWAVPVSMDVEFTEWREG